MDNLANITRDLSEIVFEAKLESGNIETVFEYVLFNDDFTKQCSFYYIDQKTLTRGTLANLSKEIAQRVIQNVTHITKKSHELLVKTYAERGQLFILVISGEHFLVTKSEIMRLLLNELKRCLAEGELLKRGIKVDVLVAMLVGNKDHDTKNYIDDNLNKLQLHNTTSEMKKENTNENEIASKEQVEKDKHGPSSNISLVVPRPSHTTTYVECDRNDVYEEDLIYCTNPNGKEQYENVLFPHYQRHPADEQYSTQVTEVDAGLLSLVPQHGYTSTTRNFESAQAGFSSTGDDMSFIQQTGLRRSMVTSGSGLSFHSKPSRYTEYRDQKKRHESFHTPKWQADSKPDVNLLVECGFFFTGNHDLVRCYHCGIGLKDWIKEDDILTEHVKYSSACDFLIWKYGKNQINRMKAALATEGNNEAGSSPPPLQYPIRSPRYQTMEARVASLELFPSNINIPHQQLAVAGLFYTGQGDLCRCFTCDGGLKDWKSGDDPIKEHATYFPNCPYINKVRGTEYVQLQQQNRTGSELMGAGATRGENAPTQSTESSPNIPIDRLTLQDTEYSSFNVSQVVQNLGYSEMDVITAKSELERKGKPYPSVEEIINTLLDVKEREKQMQAGATGQEIQPDLEAIIEENKKLSSLMYCMLCVNGEADILFLPCTHHRTCHECAADLIFCPVCGQFIKEKVKTYRA